MSKDGAVVRVRFKCSGRGQYGEAVLKEKIAVEAVLSKRYSDDENYSCDVNCPYNTGGHGQRCRASHPREDKVGDGIICPYSFDYPFVLEFDSDWQPPAELVKAIKLLLE